MDDAYKSVKFGENKGYETEGDEGGEGAPHSSETLSFFAKKIVFFIFNFFIFYFFLFE